MLERFKSSGPTAMDVATLELVASMNEFGPEDPEYQRKMDQLDQLTKIQNRQTKSKWRRVSPDTLAIVIGNVVTVLIIVLYEERSVLSTKANQFTLKTPGQ